MKEKNLYRKIELERRYFKVNDAGDNEFDWFLQELGIDNTANIDSITITVSDYETEN